MADPNTALHNLDRTMRITTMDENRLSGAARNVGGKIEEGIGSLASDAKTQVQGKLDQATGAVQASALRANFIGRKTKTNRLPASAMGTYRQALSAFVLSPHALLDRAVGGVRVQQRLDVGVRQAHCGA